MQLGFEVTTLASNKRRLENYEVRDIISDVSHGECMSMQRTSGLGFAHNIFKFCVYQSPRRVEGACKNAPPPPPIHTDTFDISTRLRAGETRALLDAIFSPAHSGDGDGTLYAKKKRRCAAWAAAIAHSICHERCRRFLLKMLWISAYTLTEIRKDDAPPA
jgi:hypothetical protein